MFFTNGPRLSLASVLCHNSADFHLQIVHEDEIGVWIDHLHPAFQYLIPAHKADYFRARILDAYGGLYIDADSIGLASFWLLFEKLRWYDIVNISWPPDGDRIAITTMGPFRANSHMTAKWVTNLHQHLDDKMGSLESFGLGQSKDYPLGWAEILRNIVKPLVDQLLKESLHFTYFSLTGQKTFGQFVTSGFDPKTNLTDMKRPFNFRNTELLMYHHSGVADFVKHFNTSHFLTSDLLLAEILRYSFNECIKDERNLDASIVKSHLPVPSWNISLGPQSRFKKSDKNMILRWTKKFLRKNRLD